MVSCLLPRDVMYGTHQPSLGFRTALEERFYMRDPATNGPYAAMEVCYLKYLARSVEIFESVRVSDTVKRRYLYEDSIRVDKSTTSINFKIGRQWAEGDFVFEVFAGVGARYRVVKHYDRTRPADRMEVPRHPNVHYAALVDGANWILSLPMGFKLGWRF